jgi:hypothetical protein
MHNIHLIEKHNISSDVVEIKTVVNAISELSLLTATMRSDLPKTKTNTEWYPKNENNTEWYSNTLPTIFIASIRCTTSWQYVGRSPRRSLAATLRACSACHVSAEHSSSLQLPISICLQQSSTLTFESQFH